MSVERRTPPRNSARLSQVTVKNGLALFSPVHSKKPSLDPGGPMQRMEIAATIMPIEAAVAAMSMSLAALEGHVYLPVLKQMEQRGLTSSHPLRRQQILGE